jgi:4-hydroxybenzoate polyprenyltransferase
MKKAQATVKDYVQAIRPQNSMLTALALALPVILVRNTLDLYILGLLFEGFLLNSAASIHNNIADFAYDQKVKYTSDRVVGTKISMGKAKALWGAIQIGSIVLGLLYVQLNIWGILALAFTIGIVAIYNIMGKTHFIWGICISLGIGSLVWLGSILAGGVSNIDMFIILYLAFQSGFMQNLEGGLKDVQTDVSNMAASLGVRVKKDKMKISGAFWAVTYGTKTIQTLLLFYIMYATIGLLHPVAIVNLLITVLSYIVIYHMLAMKKFNRKSIIQHFGYNEALTWIMLPLFLAPFIQWWIVIFVAFLPLVFYVIYNRTVHGQALVPDI